MKTRESGMPPESYWESFFNPEAILRNLGLDRAQGPIVDIGAGYGTFSLAAARVTRQPVVAIDINASVLHALADRARHENCNVQTIVRDVVADGTGLSDGYADVVLVFNLLHCERPIELLKEAKRTLRPLGRIAVLHWRSDIRTPRGPNLSIRPRPDQCVAWLCEAGFAIVVSPKVLPPYHFGLVGRAADASSDICNLGQPIAELPNRQET